MSAYLGRRGLELLRERLSERDLAVLRSVREHRFLTASHIEQLHFFDHATNGSGGRICRRVLARLARERVLSRLDRRVGGVRAGSASYVYALGPVGGRLIDGTRNRVTEPSSLFLTHTLAIADARVALMQAARSGQLELVGVEVEPACWRRYVGIGGAPEIVRPDLYVVTASKEYEHCFFVEVDMGTESPAAVGRKCQAYELYRRSGREQAEHGTFPLVVWVAPNESRATWIESVISRTKRLKGDLFRTTTANALVELIAGGGA
jgi:hypothetical protein